MQGKASMSKSDWQHTRRTCWCGETFLPKSAAQRHCCTRHERIYTRARKGAWGRNLIKENPAFALVWYAYIQ